MTQHLRHLTLNTGDMAIVPPLVLARRERLSYAAIVTEGGGPVPRRPDLHVAIVWPDTEEPRAAYWQIAQRPGLVSDPLALGFTCWDQAATPSAWSRCLELYDSLKAPLTQVRLWRDPPDIPPATPWLAAIVLPDIVQAETMLALGRVEQCLAYALMANEVRHP